MTGLAARVPAPTLRVAGHVAGAAVSLAVYVTCDFAGLEVRVNGTGRAAGSELSAAA
jgi:hypothetical protein